jgi:hypothetical protein
VWHPLLMDMTLMQTVTPRELCKLLLNVALTLRTSAPVFRVLKEEVYAE